MMKFQNIDIDMRSGAALLPRTRSGRSSGGSLASLGLRLFSRRQGFWCGRFAPIYTKNTKPCLLEGSRRAMPRCSHNLKS